MNKINLDELYEKARQAANAAYAPFSRFRVGAALLGSDGKVYTGCNVENRSFGLTLCAERTAVVKAVSEGCRYFLAIAIATPDSLEPVGPCGACRQVLSEFMKSEAPVRFGGGTPSGGSGPEQVTTTIGSLVPFDSLHDLAT